MLVLVLVFVVFVFVVFVFVFVVLVFVVLVVLIVLVFVVVVGRRFSAHKVWLHWYLSTVRLGDAHLHWICDVGALMCVCSMYT